MYSFIKWLFVCEKICVSTLYWTDVLMAIRSKTLPNTVADK